VGPTSLLTGREWLAFDVLIVVIAAAVVTMLLVFVRKGRRDRAEQRSRGVRAELLSALESDDERALLAATARMADRRASDQVDLLAVLSASPRDSWWTDDTTARLREALESHKVVDALERQLSARSAAERGTAVLLGSHPSCRLPIGLIAARMRDRDSTVRLAAASALERIGTPEAAHALIDGLDAHALPNPRIIERLGHPWAVEVCILRLAALDAAYSNGIRAGIARALGLAGDPVAVPTLLWLLEGGDANEAIQSMRALAECAPRADKEAAKQIANAARERLASADCVLVLMATRALAVTARKRDIDAFADLVGHRDWHVRREAAVGLTGMGRRGIEALLAVANGPDRYAANRAREELQLAGVLDGDDRDG